MRIIFRYDYSIVIYSDFMDLVRSIFYWRAMREEFYTSFARYEVEVKYLTANLSKARSIDSFSASAINVALPAVPNKCFG